MKFEVEKKGNKKKIIIGTCIFLLIGIVLVVKNSFAKYSSIKTIHIVNGVVNYTRGDFSIVAMYKNDGSGDTEITTMPSEGYTINSKKSYCTLNGVKDTNVQLYTSSNGDHSFKGLSKNDKCYLYFDKGSILNRDVIIANQGGSKGKYNSNDAFTDISTSEETGIYESYDEWGKSYYFRGDEDKLSNWVQFAGFYWRIIRINGNGSIRMIYSGAANGNVLASNKTGEGTYVSNTSYNSKDADNTYVGYMHTLNNSGTTSADNVHQNNYDSTIKIANDNWYKTNIYDKGLNVFVDSESGFCNDRSIASGSGYGNSVTTYESFNRISSTTAIPTLMCTNEARDLFTSSNSSKGNKKLTYPVGLITSDELIFAGGFYNKSNTNFYLYTNQSYWTMSPKELRNSDYLTFVMDLGSGGSLNHAYVSYFNIYNIMGLRPVINLLPTTIKSGSGSETDPYVVLET